VREGIRDAIETFMMSEQLALRILVIDPPAGVPWALQLGRDELLRPRNDGTTLVFEFTVTLGPSAPDGSPTFRGPATQGPVHGRFVYLCSGKRAGAAASPWDRRAKIPLGGITAAMVSAVRATPGTVLEARIAGTDRRGGPACATVPLLNGWELLPGR
jgi:hypothetical protein